MTHPDWDEDSWEGKLLIDEDTNDKEKSLTWENISSPKQDEALRKLAKLKIHYKGKLEPVLDLVTIAETSKPPKYKGTVYQRTLVGSSPPLLQGCAPHGGIQAQGGRTSPSGIQGIHPHGHRQ